MDAIKAFAEKRSLDSVLLTLLLWFLASRMLAAVSAALLDVPMIEAVPQMIGSLGATLVLLAIAGWLGWLPSIGIVSLGSWRLWLITIPLLAYLLMAYLYGFFGTCPSISASLPVRKRRAGYSRGMGSLALSKRRSFGASSSMHWSGYGGRSKRGILLSALVQAALFAIPHLLQAMAGISWTEVLMVILIELPLVLLAIWLLLRIPFGSEPWQSPDSEISYNGENSPLQQAWLFLIGASAPVSLTTLGSVCT